MQPSLPRQKLEHKLQKRSWPAVSHNYKFTSYPVESSLNFFFENSAPMVGLAERDIFLQLNASKREVFPTPESPIMINFKNPFYYYVFMFNYIFNLQKEQYQSLYFMYFFHLFPFLKSFILYCSMSSQLNTLSPRAASTAKFHV